MKDEIIPDLDLRAAVASYCGALHNAQGDVLEALCDPRFLMQWAGTDGAIHAIDKAAFVARVGGRKPFAGSPEFEILSIDVAGDEMAQVKLNVAVPPRVYTDQLGFLKVGGTWRLVTKLFRVADGPAVEV